MISTHIDGAVGHLILDRPEKKNAFTSQMYADFAAALEAYSSDPNVHVVVVAATGDDFCAGNDLKDFAASASVDAAVVSDPAQSPPAKAVHALIDMDKPVIASVQGRAIGFGATMLLHFDCVVMEENAQIIYPFIDLGLVPEACSSVLLEDCVGRMRARQLIFDAQPIGAKLATEIGLAAAMCQTGNGQAKALETARIWASRSSRTLIRSKSLMGRSRQELRVQANREFSAFVEALADPETQRGFQAMIAR